VAASWRLTAAGGRLQCFKSGLWLTKPSELSVFAVFWIVNYELNSCSMRWSSIGPFWAALLRELAIHPSLPSQTACVRVIGSCNASSSVIERCQVLSSAVKRCQAVLSVKCCQALPSGVKCQVLSSVAKRCQAVPSVVKCRQEVSSVVKCRQEVSSVVKWC
jgi:hypothetical protein